MLPNKLAIANSFSKAALDYDKLALFQRDVGHRLLAHLPSSLPNNNVILDMGCGTGYFLTLLNDHYPLAHTIGLDLSEGMLQLVKQKAQQNKLILGDAEHLPIQDSSVDIVFSNLTLQWCHNFSGALEEVYRVLKPQGIFLFTTLCDGSLTELKQSWKVVDDDVHINDFFSLDTYQQFMSQSTFTIKHAQQVAEVTYHETVYDVMRSLKGIGAKNMNPKRHKGLTGHGKFNKVAEHYEKFREVKGLPCTYQVLTGFLIKSI